MATITALNGREFTTAKPGEYLNYNKKPGYTPGSTFVIRNNKLIRDINDVTPYQNKIELLEVSEKYALCSINGNSWYIFNIKTNDKGEQMITTSFTPATLNSDKEAVFNKFQEMNQHYEAQLIAEKTKVDEQNQYLKNMELRTARIGQVKVLKMKAFNELHQTVSSKEINGILLDAEVCEIIDRFYKYDLILKTL